MTQHQQHIETARIQKEISKRLNLPIDQLIFDFSTEGKIVQLNLITINPKHDQSFLYHTVERKTKVEALQEMLEYVVKNSRQEQSYTVQWAKAGEGELHTSYFRAKDMFEVLEKFSHGRDMADYNVFSITLNPIA